MSDWVSDDEALAAMAARLRSSGASASHVEGALLRPTADGWRVVRGFEPFVPADSAHERMLASSEWAAASEALLRSAESVLPSELGLRLGSGMRVTFQDGGVSVRSFLFSSGSLPWELSWSFASSFAILRRVFAEVRSVAADVRISSFDTSVPLWTATPIFGWGMIGALSKVEERSSFCVCAGSAEEALATMEQMAAIVIAFGFGMTKFFWKDDSFDEVGWLRHCLRLTRIERLTRSVRDADFSANRGHIEVFGF